MTGILGFGYGGMGWDGWMGWDGALAMHIVVSDIVYIILYCDGGGNSNRFELF